MERIEVQTLQEVEELVHELLGLEDKLGREIADRAAGVPLFAVQLVADLVHRKVLVPCGQGLRLRPGARVELPVALHDLWLGNLERLCAADDVDRLCVEIGATLGREVDGLEWTQACQAAEVQPSRHLLERMVSQRLAMIQPGAPPRWTFQHGMLVECILRTAVEQGRLEGHHRACAQMLASRTDGHALARRARHLLNAGEHEAALEPLLTDASALSARSEYAAAEDAMQLWSDAMAVLDPPSADVRWGRGINTWAELENLRGRFGNARARFCALRDAAQEHGWRHELGSALRGLGSVAFATGDKGEARRYLESALAVAVETTDVELVVRCRLRLATLLLRLNKLKEAKEHLSAALELPGVRGPSLHQRLGVAAMLEGDLDDAELSLDTARILAEEQGNRNTLAFVLSVQGDVERARGEWKKSASRCRQAAELFRATGHRAEHNAMLSLAHCQLHQGKSEEARQVLTPLMAAFSADGRLDHMEGTRLMLAWAAALEADWGVARSELRTFAMAARQLGMADNESAEIAETIGGLAAAGSPALATLAWKLAVDLYRSGGNTEDADRIERTKTGIDAPNSRRLR